MSLREPEPEAHCYSCIQAKTGNCAEFNALNPRYMGGYDRKWCHWGAESQGHLLLIDPKGKLVLDKTPKTGCLPPVNINIDARENYVKDAIIAINTDTGEFTMEWFLGEDTTGEVYKGWINVPSKQKTEEEN